MTKRLVQGNEAVLQGAIRAGATYFAGYPISPSSEILAAASVHASTQFSHELRPPRARGKTWSIESSGVPGRRPQYWQRFSSRRNKLRRLNDAAGLG